MKPDAPKPYARLAAMLALLLLCACSPGPGTSSALPLQEPPPEAGVVQFAEEPESLPLPEPEPEPEPEPLVEEHRFSFSAVGDNLIHDSIYKQAAARAGGEGYDFSYCYENLSYFFAGFDVNWINQESLITSLPPEGYPNFSTPTEMGRDAYAAGWRVFALSNNHTYDKLATGLEETLSFWQTMPEDTLYPGLFQDPDGESDIVYQEVNGITVAYLCFTEHTNGITTPAGAPAVVVYTAEQERMERLVRAAREAADLVVVGMHWGTEDSHVVNDNQRYLAALLAEWGTDVVLGTHPHVVQPVEWVERPDGGQMLLAYSLGNFLSSQRFADQMIGLCLTFEVVMETTDGETTRPATVENVAVYPTVTHYEAGAANVRTYMYRDYTAELAAVHGTHKHNAFSMEYIRGVLEAHVSEEFLVLD